MVSRVHSGSRNAKAFGTDRNTDLTDYTPATTNTNCLQGQPTESKTETDSSNRMRDLNYELKQLCLRNRDGSYATQRDRERVLDLVADQLHEMGYRHLAAASLKPKHVEGLVERWQAERLAVGPSSPGSRIRTRRCRCGCRPPSA